MIDLAPTTSTPPAPAEGPLPDCWRDQVHEGLAELAGAWQSDNAWTGMTKAGGVDLPGEICGLVALDEVLLHGWDVAIATGQTYQPADSESEAASHIPLLHLGDVTADAVLDAGLDTVGLLGTAFTMSQDFHRGQLESRGLTVLVPDDVPVPSFPTTRLLVGAAVERALA